MTTYTPPAALEKRNTRIFFFLLFLYQVIFIFQGVDLSDEGFYATFYQQVFTDPEATQYNFMFWFSGIVAGAFDYVFHGFGIWGMRLAGVIVTTSTIIITYNLLKKYLNPGYLKLGLLMVLLFINNNLKEIHYNDLSALFNMLAILYLFTGLKENRLWKLFLAGLFISLCTFTRLPNVLSLGLGIGIFYYGYHNKNSFKVQMGQALTFGGGFIFMTAVIIGFMKLIGHLDIFINSIKLLSKMSKGGEESFYGPMVLIKNFFGTYIAATKSTLIILAAIAVVSVIANFIKKKIFYSKWLFEIAGYIIVLGVLYLIFKGKIDNEIVLYFFSGIVLITTLLIFFFTKNTDIKFLALAGCFILVTYPFTSSASLFTVGKYSLWLSFPIAIDYIFNIRSVDRLTFGSKSISLPAFLSFSEIQLKQIRKFTVISCVLACLYFTYYYPFFDKHNRMDMHYSINNKYMRGIYTTKERALSLNELLGASSQYIKPGDYVLAYHSIPMFHYWTETKPYLRNSMPWFYEAGLFGEELKTSFEEKKILPVVVEQLKKTVGNAGEWPDPPAFYDSAWHKKNAPRDSVLNEFLGSHRYTEVWKNKYFKILIPPAKDSL
jgi:Dolichyl-phosphate-mannose-protein mannosyltransferase